MTDATEDAKPDRHVMRMLAQQIAVAQIDGLRGIERAARRALRAYKRGSTEGLDPEALEALAYAQSSIVLVRRDDTKAAE